MGLCPGARDTDFETSLDNLFVGTMTMNLYECLMNPSPILADKSDYARVSVFRRICCPVNKMHVISQDDTIVLNSISPNFIVVLIWVKHINHTLNVKTAILFKSRIQWAADMSISQ